MGVIWSKSKPSKEDYFEKVLTSLQDDIKQVQLRIQRLKQQSRTLQVHIVLVSVAFYGCYVAYTLFQYKLTHSQYSSGHVVFKLIGLVFIPFSSFYLKRFISKVFTVFITRHERNLLALQEQLKLRIEELKTETRYYQTKGLIEKYEQQQQVEKKEKEKDNSNKKISAFKGGNAKQRLDNNKQVPQLQLQQQQQLPSPQHSSQSQASRPLNMQMRPLMRGPTGPATIPRSAQFQRSHDFKSPTWLDRLMDSIIGDDSRNQKYALICARCYNHNGIVPPEQFNSIRYTCPNCGLFNVHAPIEKSPKIEEIVTESDGTVKEEENKKEVEVEVGKRIDNLIK